MGLQSSVRQFTETSCREHSTLRSQHPYRMVPMEAAREEAGELPGDEDRSRGEMRFSCPLAARCRQTHEDEPGCCRRYVNCVTCQLRHPPTLLQHVTSASCSEHR